METGRTYAVLNGFGHEEWLFNKRWILDGWKYSFLQPVNDSISNVEGKALNLVLFTIGPASDWQYVGELKNVEVLTEEQADGAVRKFVSKGWLREMREHLKAVDADPKTLDIENPRGIFNIRVRPSDAVLFDQPLSIEANDPIRGLRRYKLVALDGKLAAVAKAWPKRCASQLLKIGGRQSRVGGHAIEVDLVHNDMQNELYRLLRIKYGADSVQLEKNYVDISVNRGSKNGLALVEIKSDSRPVHAIRQALGQLLEYSYVSIMEGIAAKELIVVAPGESTQTSEEYVKYLMKTFQIPLRYVCFRSGMKESGV